MDVLSTNDHQTLNPDEEAADRWYEVDASNRLIDVDPFWDVFALANGAQGNVTRDKIIGQPLMDFVTGDMTRMYVDVALKSARLKQMPRVLSYRCDAPGLKRWLEMTVEPLSGGRVRISHRLVSSSPTKIRSEFRYSPKFVQWLRCSQCLKLALIDTPDVWHLPESIDLFQSGGVVMVSDSVCPACQAQATSQ